LAGWDDQNVPIIQTEAISNSLNSGESSNEIPISDDVFLTAPVVIPSDIRSFDYYAALSLELSTSPFAKIKIRIDLNDRTNATRTR
jgi:hypothetical protein